MENCIWNYIKKPGIRMYCITCIYSTLKCIEMCQDLRIRYPFYQIFILLIYSMERLFIDFNVIYKLIAIYLVYLLTV